MPERESDTLIRLFVRRMLVTPTNITPIEAAIALMSIADQHGFVPDLHLLTALSSGDRQKAFELCLPKGL